MLFLEVHFAAGCRLDLRHDVVGALPSGTVALDLVGLLPGGELADLVGTKLLALGHVRVGLRVQFVLHLICDDFR